MDELLIPNELQILTFLKPRTNLRPEIKRQLQQLQNGYAGESQFYKVIKQKLSEHCLPLFNLLLESDGSFFQIDCLILCNDTIYMYEVKNYAGDYYLHNDRWYIVRSKKEIRNPLLQLERSNYLLNELIQKFPARFEIKSYIIFVNKTFMLYQAPLDLPIIFPSQIKRHINILNRQVGPYANLKQQRRLAEWLIEQQVEQNFANIPEYSFDSLKKGVFCKKCLRGMTRYKQNRMLCQTCNYTNQIETMVLENIKQFTILFPEMKITTNNIYMWCGKTISRKTILRILKKNFMLISRGKNSYFINKS